MFTGSSGSISNQVHPGTLSSTEELERAVAECLELSPEGDCHDSPHGPIGAWDVSSISNMDKIFLGASTFNGDLWKWDVSSVTTMALMFSSATSFKGDISKWDVSRVNDLRGMFWSAVQR